MSDEDFAEAIREAREQRGWSQEFLAAKVGATQSTIDRIESGATRKSRVLPEIAAALDLNLPGLEKKQEANLAVGGFVKVSYVLPQELINSIEKYKRAIGVASDDEVVRRILNEFIRRRDDVEVIITNLLAKYKSLRSMRDAAGLILANHPLVKTMTFNGGGVYFELEEGLTVEADSHGGVYIKRDNGSYYKFYKPSAPSWASALNVTEDINDIDDIPF